MIVTSSWDDGHPLDFKILDILDKYRIKSTFYIPLSNRENRVMTLKQIEYLSKYQEVGGHTVNHLYLNHLNDTEAGYEIEECKKLLGNACKKEIQAFCFPGGKFTKRDIRLAKKSGFEFCRTANFFQTTLSSESFLMDTTFQIYNHSWFSLAKHCLKRRYFHTLIRHNLFIQADKDFKSFGQSLVNHISGNGILHFWGHSWEIEKYNLWKDLEEFLKLLTDRPDIVSMNNSECWSYIQQLNRKR